ARMKWPLRSTPVGPPPFSRSHSRCSAWLAQLASNQRMLNSGLHRTPAQHRICLRPAMIGVTVPLSGLSNHHSTTTPAQRRSQSDATGSREDKLTTLDQANE